MWDLILNPFVTLMALLYSALSNNIVLAIVVFTILTRIAMYPLFARQQRSTKQMQEIQPQLKKLQEKYKNDREKLAQEQMELYRKYGINPLGGCLLLLVQFPIFIGVYQAINFALASSPYQLVDLSQRLLIPDLARLIPIENTWLGMDLTLPPTVNPTYALVLPLLVMVTTWLQTKMTLPQTKPSEDGQPSQPDQAQAMTQSMTTVMPLMFGMFALSFSVGLSIYFIVSNVVGIVQYSPIGKRVLDQLFGQKDTPLNIEAMESDKPNKRIPKAKTADASVSPTHQSASQKKKARK